MNTKGTKYLVADFESRSRCDLKKFGAWEYSKDASTRILCLSARYGTKEELRNAPTFSWSPFLKDEIPEVILEALLNPEVILVAHNALFEQAITRNVLPRYFSIPYLKCIPPERWICTAAQAAAMGLPRRLEGAASALGLMVQKDMEGHKLVLKYCKPRKPSKSNPNIFWNSKKDLLRIIQYCETDIGAEVELFLKLPPLNPQERKIWELDQKINLHGIRVDRDLVSKILELIELEKENLDDETFSITLGEILSTTQRAGVLDFLKAEGVELPNLQAKTVVAALRNQAIPEEAKRVLEIRQAISKTSTAKYLAFKNRSTSDGVVRDNLVYHTAHTGRWGGAGVQCQNLPRSMHDAQEIKEILEILRSNNAKQTILEDLRLFYREPMLAFSSCLRAMIIAREGKEFFCADYSAIETHVLFWVARHEEGLKALREKRDLYKEMASVIYKMPVEQITKESRERFIGKESVLGCGYQMGGKAFMKNCINKGVDIPAATANLAVEKYREFHKPVTKLWETMEKAAIYAVRHPGKKVTINRVGWFMRGDFLHCELPSKRLLSYYKPRIQMEPTPWGEIRPKLYTWHTNSFTKQWVEGATYGGKLTENIVQAISRDIMAEAMLRVDRAGFEVVLSVHDELLSEAPIGTRDLKEYTDLLEERPTWGQDIPIRVEGWRDIRYKK